MTDRKHQVTVKTRKGHVHQIYRTRKGGLTIHSGKAAKTKTGRLRTHLDHHQVGQVRGRARSRGWTVEVSTGRHYPLIHKASAANWPTDHRLLHAINECARDLNRYAFIVSGLRTNSEQCALVARMRRGGPLAAPCNPCRSNHCRGVAADFGFVGGDGKYRSAGLHPGALAVMRRHHVGLDVPSEPWHAEYGRAMLWAP